jgi:hypothetical protein
MLAGLVARVKKLRTKLMVGDLRRTEVVFVVVDDGLVWAREGFGLLYWNETRSRAYKAAMTCCHFSRSRSIDYHYNEVYSGTRLLITFEGRGKMGLNDR